MRRMQAGMSTLLLAIAAVCGVGILCVVQCCTPRTPIAYRADMQHAALLMRQCEERVAELRTGLGIPIDRHVDINATGLIGVEYSDITTSMGNLEAKRSVTNPEMAALMVRLYHEAGAEQGDTIAIGASGSFPGALFASLAAATAMDLNVLLILSCGASNWGANIPELTILDMYAAVRDLVPVDLLAASLGGRYDTGHDMMDEGRLFLLERLNRSGASVILEPDLASSVEKRLSLYNLYCGAETQIAAFVNIGGADANIGEGVGVLDLAPGINYLTADDAKPAADGGVLFAMGSQGIPVIHILNVKMLLTAYQVGWDPVPLPAGTDGNIYYETVDRTGRLFLLIGALAVYLSVLYALSLWYKVWEKKHDRETAAETGREDF